MLFKFRPVFFNLLILFLKKFLPWKYVPTAKFKIRFKFFIIENANPLAFKFKQNVES